jgi:hypothetical protein
VVVLGGIVDYCEIGYARFNVTIMSYEWKKEIVPVALVMNRWCMIVRIGVTFCY